MPTMNPPQQEQQTPIDRAAFAKLAGDALNALSQMPDGVLTASVEQLQACFSMLAKRGVTTPSRMSPELPAAIVEFERLDDLGREDVLRVLSYGRRMDEERAREQAREQRHRVRTRSMRRARTTAQRAPRRKAA